MRGGVLDLGSYTFHALVADVDAYGLRRTVFEKTTFGRTPQELEALVSRTLAKRPSDLRVIATAPEPFLDEVCARHGLTVERIDGNDRAMLCWLGVSAELSGSHGELCVVALNGSSIEVATGNAELTRATSLPLGVLALGPMSPAEVRRHVMREAGCLAKLRGFDTFALASGTVRALVKLGRRLGIISDLQRHVGARTFAELARRLSPLDAPALARLGVKASRRATIASGAVAITTLLELLGNPVIYAATQAMREGALVELARRRRSMPLLLASGMS